MKYKDLIIANVLLLGVLLLAGIMLKPAKHYEPGARVIVERYLGK